MNSIKLLAVLAAFGILATPALAQSTNSMGNSMGSMGSGSMMKGSMDKPMMDKGMSSKRHMMPMHHMAMSKKTMARCHKMSHSGMTHNHKCRAMMMKHGKMMKHDM